MSEHKNMTTNLMVWWILIIYAQDSVWSISIKTHFRWITRHVIILFFVFFAKIATPASEVDGEGIRADLEASAAQMDVDATATGNISQGGTPTPDEHQKQSSDTDNGQEAGQLEADAEVEAGMIDGETDAEVDLDAVGWYAGIVIAIFGCT